jgi:hypothetical protein
LTGPRASLEGEFLVRVKTATTISLAILVALSAPVLAGGAGERTKGPVGAKALRSAAHFTARATNLLRGLLRRERRESPKPAVDKHAPPKVVAERLSSTSPHPIEITEAVRSAWDTAMARVEQAASPDLAPRTKAAMFVKQAINGEIDDLTATSMTATKAQAHDLSQRLDWLGNVGLTTTQRRRVQNLKTALNDFADGTTNRVIIDPVAVHDSPIESLVQSNFLLRMNVMNAYVTEMNLAMVKLTLVEQLALLNLNARSAFWGSDLDIPAAVKQRLIENNEWSTFAGQVSAHALDMLAKIGTPEALAEVALQITANVRITDDHFFMVSEKARHILQQADRTVVRSAFEIAKQSLEAPPYRSDAYHQRTLANALRILSSQLP